MRDRTTMGEEGSICLPVLGSANIGSRLVSLNQLAERSLPQSGFGVQTGECKSINTCQSLRKEQAIVQGPGGISGLSYMRNMGTQDLP